jgi:hypothetical protein
MIKAFLNVQNLDWSGWILGVVGAAISGGAGAVASGFGTMIVDPQHFNLQNPTELFKVMAVVFGFSAIISLAKYLQTTPVPTALAQKVQTAQQLASATKIAVDEVKASLPEPKP